jgi:hypothetical protein
MPQIGDEGIRASTDVELQPTEVTNQTTVMEALPKRRVSSKVVPRKEARKVKPGEEAAGDFGVVKEAVTPQDITGAVVGEEDAGVLEVTVKEMPERPLRKMMDPAPGVDPPLSKSLVTEK